MNSPEHQGKPEEGEPVEAELIPPETTAVAVAETITELATRGTAGKLVIETRKQIIEHAIRSSIWLTFPEDWTLFKDKISGRVTGYLGDPGCKRVMGIWQIQPMLKDDGPNPDRTELGTDFAYTYRGDAYCRLINTWVYDVEGTRCSTDQYAQQVKQALLREVRVKQAAKANFEGNCVRRLAGLQSIPESFLNDVWKGTGKTSARCAGGVGFGTRQERDGTTARSDQTPNIKPPICDACMKEMAFYPGGSKDGRTWGADWKCPDYKWDSKTRMSIGGHSKVSAADWEKTVASQPKQEAGEAPREAGSDDK
jgi:hypothetical protein